MDAKFEIERLRTVLNQAGYEYYVMDNPTMSDYDYDHQQRYAPQNVCFKKAEEYSQKSDDGKLGKIRRWS